MRDHDDADGRGLTATVAASSIGELCWVGGDGRPQVQGVVALIRGGRPVVAFTWADEDLAREAARSERVVLGVRERRSTGPGFRPLLVHGRPHLTEDVTGEVFVAELIAQELRRYPPARLYADSPLLMREHWWYLPRLLLEVEVEVVEPTAPVEGPYDNLLVVANGGRPVVRPVARAVAEPATGPSSGPPADPSKRPALDAPPAPRLALDVLGAPPPPGPAAVFGQDASFPDLERWAQWHHRGHWDGAAGLAVEEAPATTGLGGPPGLLRRWRRQRTLERRCVRALTRARA